MYDFNWHKLHGDKTSSSAIKTLQQLWAFYPAASVLDVGCGDGRWLSVAKALGAQSIQGVDGPWTDLARLLIPAEDVHIQDLSSRLDLKRRYDLAISLEVAEHVAKRHAEQFVDNLARHADVVLFGAAIPYQGGFRHINEQWPSYWATLFKRSGYRCFDPFRSQLWSDQSVHYWYKQNMLLFVNTARPDLIEKVETHLQAARIPELPLDIVHPEKYEGAAGYRQIAFKPLLAQLPRQAFAKASSILLRKN